MHTFKNILPFLTIIAALISILFCSDSDFSHGERLYKANCANCHLENGQGIGLLMPPLARADYLQNNRAALPCILKNGIKDSIVVNGKNYVEVMPGAKHLSDVQITNILNYVQTSWGNQNPVFRLDEVRKALKECN
jgi:mono/diheme cytochrome c family protein